jgi:hypothetical protein
MNVTTEVDKLPLDTLLFVLFLFQDKHVVVEELLQSFIGVVESPNFTKPGKAAKGKNGDFELHHYAGNVSKLIRHMRYE